MGEIVKSITGAFTEMITGLAGAVRGAFDGLLFDTASGGEQTLSKFAIFVFVMMGIGMAVGIFHLVMKLICNH